VSINDTHKLEAGMRNALTPETESVGVSGVSPFIVMSMPSVAWHFCQNAAQFQHALYLVASEQASAAVQEARRRRQLFFSRGVHLWN
jgi:hypothetical protein